MKKFNCVEDYLEYLGGWPIGMSFVDMMSSSTISLDGIDVKIITSISTSTISGVALTDRQADIVCRLILKYKQQFANHNISVFPVENPLYRRPLRYINRVKKIWIENDMIHFYFPYEQSLTDELKRDRKDLIGLNEFNPTTKTWDFALSEYNVNWLVTLAQLNNFDIAPDILRLYDMIVEIEKAGYVIELVEADDGYSITNGADGLIEYINEHLGGFGTDNLQNLVDNSGILGYTVNEALLSRVNELVACFGVNRSTYLTPTHWNLEFALEYAKQSNRYPVLIYDPAGTTTVHSCIGEFSGDEVVNLSNYFGKSQMEYTSNAKIIYATKLPKENLMERIPLMISYHELLVGMNKYIWVERSDRLIYLCGSTLTQ